MTVKEIIVELDHTTVVVFAKTWVLFYLMAFAVAVLVYAFWPANRKIFNRAKHSILDRDDKPWK